MLRRLLLYRELLDLLKSTSGDDAQAIANTPDCSLENAVVTNADTRELARSNPSHDAYTE
jgi:hypothetical protein